MNIKYNKLNHEILSRLYQFRVLSYSEIYNYIFKSKNLKESYCDKILKTVLLKNGFAKKSGYYKSEATYQITQKGINYLKKTGIIKLDGLSLEDDPLMLTASELRMKENIVKHQTSLAHFILEWSSTDRFDYYDEKYVSKILNGVKPDGLVITDDIYYFVEMDMNTERKTSLLKKWNSYRTFLKSGSRYDIKHKICVLFVIGGGNTNKSKRRDYIMRDMVDNLFDYISEDFNVLVGTEEELLKRIHRDNRSVIKNAFENYGFKIYKGTSKDGSFAGYSFDYFCPMIKDGKEVELGYVLQEFIVDDMTDGNLYSMLKIKNAASIQSMYSHKMNRYIKIILVVETEERVLELYKLVDNINDLIYFTTPSRLTALPLNFALFQTDGNKRWHFSQESLRVRVFE